MAFQSLQPKKNQFTSLGGSSAAARARRFLQQNASPAPQSVAPTQSVPKAPLRSPAQTAAAIKPPAPTPRIVPKQNIVPQAPRAPINTQTITPPTVKPTPTFNRIVPSGPTPKTQALREQLVQSFAPTSEETGLQSQLNAILTGEEKGQEAIRTQPIATPFLRGQAAALQRQTGIESAPLQRQLGLLQQQRQIQQQGAETRLGFERQDATVRRESQQQRRESLQEIAQAAIERGATQEQINEILGAGSTEAGLSIAARTGLLREQEETKTQIVQAGGRSLLVNSQTGETIKDLGSTEGSLARFATAQQKAKDAEGSGDDPSPFLKQLGSVASNVVQDIDSRIGFTTVGPGALLTSRIPGTPAFDFSADLETLKADIGFGILQQMRDSSKTGGALGQISERELAFLQNTLGSLNQLQSQANFRKNLQKVQASINRWTAAAGEQASGGGGGGTQEEIDFLNSI